MTMNAELSEELKKLKRLSEDEAVSSKLRIEALETELRTAETTAKSHTSFAERFAANKAVADMQK